MHAAADPAPDSAGLPAVPAATEDAIAQLAIAAHKAGWPVDRPMTEVFAAWAAAVPALPAEPSDDELAQAARQLLIEADDSYLNPDGYAYGYIDGFRARAVLAAGGAPAQPDEPLAEWQCPSCGATTRARMADAPVQPGETYGNSLWWKAGPHVPVQSDDTEKLIADELWASSLQGTDKAEFRAVAAQIVRALAAPRQPPADTEGVR